MTTNPEFLRLGETEIANNTRTTRYAANAALRLPTVRQDCSCDAIADTLGPYVSPEADPAPWFDPTEPRSAEFGGLLVTDMSGLGRGRFERSIQELAGDGGVLGTARRRAPVITVTGVLVAASCCAAEWGRQWLTTVLQGPCSGIPGCPGEDLTFYACCPACEESPGSPPTCLDEEERRLSRVALISGVEVVERLGSGCRACGGSQMMRVQFTLAAERSCVTHAGLSVDLGFSPFPDESPGPEDCVGQWILVDEGDVCDECAAGESPPCPDDPLCPPPPNPPAPAHVFEPCDCEALDRAVACLDIDAADVPSHLRGAPRVDIFSGDQTLRAVRVRVFDMAESPGADPCDAIGEFAFVSIPPDSHLILDWSDENITLDCPGGMGDAVRLATPGRGVRWPVICGGVDHTICVEVDADSVGVGAQVSGTLAVMEC